MTQLQAELLELRDDGYRAFQATLIPTVDTDTIIGVRVPFLRKMAKQLAGSEQASILLTSLPHRYYEENMLHAFLIEQIKDVHACLAALDTFLPYVDNWAVCDSMSPKILGKYKAELLQAIDRWIASRNAYAVRFGIKMLMTWFLDADFSPAYPEHVASIRSDEYYVNMMIAWYFATALAKQEDAILPYLTERRLSPWIRAKAIRKALESYRIRADLKEYLKTL